MSSTAKRVYVIETIDESGIPTPDAADAWLSRMGAVLTEVGGALIVEAQREEVLDLEGEPVAVTTHLIGRWQSFSPLKRAGEQPAPEVEPAPVVAEPESEV